MGIFGWSYPPGCSGPPDDDCPDPHPAEEQLGELLTSAGVDPAIVDKACEILAGVASQLLIEQAKECPACLDRYVKEVLDTGTDF